MSTTRSPVHRSRSPQPLPAASVPPVSVDGEPWYQRVSGTSGLPSQCFSPQASLYIGCPEAALMRAVLDDALTCFERPGKPIRRWVQREAWEAEAWIFRDDAHGLFSFVSVCAVLGLEPASIRQELLRRRRSPRARRRARGHVSSSAVSHSPTP
jgi:hypothetical protein